MALRQHDALFGESKPLGEGAIKDAEKFRKGEMDTMREKNKFDSLSGRMRNDSPIRHNDSFQPIRPVENTTGGRALDRGDVDISSRDKLSSIIFRARENAALKTAKIEAAKKAQKEESLKDNLKKTGVFAGGDFNSTGIKKIGSAVGENWKSALPDSSVGTGEKTKKTFGRMFGVSSSDARVKKDLLIKMGKAIEAGKRDDPSLKGWSEEELKYVLNNPEKKHGILGGIGNALGGQYAKKWKNN